MNSFVCRVLPGRRSACLCLLGLVFCLCFRSGSAQVTPLPTIPSSTQPADSTLSEAPVSFEELTDWTLHEDALMLLARHIAVEPSWTALRVTGTVALPGVTGNPPAELILQNLNQATLKIQQTTGLVAVAVEGAFRRSTYADGTTNVDSMAAGPAGLLPLQLLHSPTLSERLLAIKVMGAQVVRGVTCDKLSLRYILTKTKPPEGRFPHNVQVDFYLNATTHQLVRSVVSVKLPGLVQGELLTTDYSGYQSFGLISFPQRITQTIGDRPLWDLSVTGVSAEAKIDSKEFVK